MITLNMIKSKFPYAVDTLLGPVLAVCNSDKDKLIRAHFLAQLAHESDGFKTVQEYASGKAYEGRKDLGNTQPGDGIRFKGRGYIQITGRSNYTSAGLYLHMNLIDNPEKLLIPDNAMAASEWFWTTHGLSRLALRDDLNGITKIINGGLNGLLDRQRCLKIFKELL